MSAESCSAAQRSAARRRCAVLHDVEFHQPAGFELVGVDLDVVELQPVMSRSGR
jgi:hypothetical protein